MKKLKALALVAVLAGSMLSPQKAEAKKIFGGTIVYSNGCVETYEIHSYLFGLITDYQTTSYLCP